MIQAALTQVISSIGQQVLQQVGQALNLPQSVIDLSIGAFAAATGNSAGTFQSIGESAAGLAQATGGGAFEAGGIERQMNDIVQDLVDKTLEKARTGGRDEEGNAVPGGLHARATATEAAWRLYDDVCLNPQAQGTRVERPALPMPVWLADQLELVDGGRGFMLRGRQADLLEIAGKRASLGDLTPYAGRVHRS